MLRFKNTIDTNDYPISVEDIDYLRRKILTERAVISESKENTIMISSLYEATKTLLTAIEFTMDIMWITKVEIIITDDKDDSSSHENTVNAVWINIDGITKKTFMGDPDSSHTLYSPNMRYHAEYSYTNPEHPNYPSGFEYNIKYVVDPMDCPNGVVSKVDVRGKSTEFKYSVVRNANSVLSYSENFPAPSQFRNMIKSQIIVPYITQVLRVYSDYHPDESSRRLIALKNPEYLEYLADEWEHVKFIQDFDLGFGSRYHSCTKSHKDNMEGDV